MKIRPANPNIDISGILRVTNAYEPRPVTFEEAAGWLLERTPGRVHQRLVALDDAEQVTGYAASVHEAWQPTGQFYAWVGVFPPNRGRGVGGALWRTVQEFLEHNHATHLDSEVLDTDPIGLEFARRRGFAIERQIFASTLDLAAFDETPYLPILARLQEEGLRFCSLADFPDIPQLDRKLRALNYVIVQDIPGKAWEETAYNKQFDIRILKAPWFRREGQLLAVDGEAWVGLAAVSLAPETHEAYNAVTGVVRDYRGRGIATALKVLAACYARERGARRITTNNDSDNVSILSVNRRLGYQPLPGKYKLSKGSIQ